MFNINDDNFSLLQENLRNHLKVLLMSNNNLKMRGCESNLVDINSLKCNQFTDYYAIPRVLASGKSDLKKSRNLTK